MHHLIDPRSGVPVVSRWRTASVAANDCVTANIASTAAIVLGAEAPEWLRRRGLAARLVDDAGTVSLTPGWPSDAEDDPMSAGAVSREGAA
jgi:thiamine biosynthesis lipoprotein